MPSNLIRVYEKNKIDLSFGTKVTITITDGVATNDGSNYVNFTRDRTNYTGFATTGSTDAANTQFDIDMGDPFNIDTLGLIRNNFASITWQYYNGVSYVDFTPPIAESGLSQPNNAEQTLIYNVGQVSTQQLRLIIQGCYPADADKVLRQIIVTRKIGEFQTQPEVRPFEKEEFKSVKNMISGRKHISRRQGGFRCRVSFPGFKTQSDLDLIENIFNSTEGRLFNFAGAALIDGTFKVPGFRPQDFYLMAPTNDLNTSYAQGRFANGITPTLDLVEVV